MAVLGPEILQQVVVALALGALVGIERERTPERKYAGIRTLSILSGSGPLAVLASEHMDSAGPVVAYLLLVGAISLFIIHVRFEIQEEDLGFTTSVTVFFLGLVGVVVGYGQYFPAVAATLLVMLLLSEKQSFQRYTERFDTDDLSEAITFGILALVLYPILPEGPVDPFEVLFLRKALFFVLVILSVQFVAFLSLQWFRSGLGILTGAAVGGVASSLAVVTTMTEYVSEDRLAGPAYSAAIAATVTMVLRNGVLAVALSPGFQLLEPLMWPFLLAAGIGIVFTVLYFREGAAVEDVDFGTVSPFSFRLAFQFGVFYLGILMLSELATTHLSVLGAYGTAFVGGFGSSTAVVASAVTLLSAGSVTESEAAIIVSLGVLASLIAKLLYSEAGGARPLTRRMVVPLALMAVAILGVLL